MISKGRVLLPSNLRDYATLDKEIVIIGVLNRIEIWDRAAWEDYNNQISPVVNDIAEQLVDLGI